jgi:tripartite-type tricarboxylate transporter receptor subunit TctC
MCAVAPSGAQQYPQRPVRIIVNVTPRGGVDKWRGLVRLTGAKF